MAAKPAAAAAAGAAAGAAGGAARPPVLSAVASYAPSVAQVSLYALTVKVISGKDLISTDLGGKSDPYVILHIDDQTGRLTTFKPNTLTPVWNESFSYVFNTRPKELKLTCMDKDTVGEDDFMGEAVIPLGRELFDSKDKKVFEDDLKLLKVKKGSIRIRVEGTLVPQVIGRKMPVVDIPDPAALSHLLKLTVVGATGLTSQILDKSDPYCVVNFGLNVFQTRVKSNTTSPVWNAFFPVWVTPATRDHIVSFQVYDKDYNKDDHLGSALLKPGLLPEGKEVEVVVPIVAAKASTDAELSAIVRDYKFDVGSKAGGPRGSLKLKVELATRVAVEQAFYEVLLAEYDLDKNGRFSLAELIHMAEVMGSKKSEEEIKKLFDAADTDKSGEIDRAELMKLLSSQSVQSDELIQMLHAAMMYGRDGLEHLLTRGVLASDASSIELKRAGSVLPAEGKEDPDHILVQDLRTGQVIRENIPAYIKSAMKLAYRTGGGQAFMSSDKVRKTLKQLTVNEGKKMDAPESVEKIPGFIALHQLNMDEVLLPLEEYNTFNEFFFRKLKPAARRCEAPDDSNVANSPADCRLMVFPTLDEAKRLWIKGEHFSVGNVLGSWDAKGDKAAAYTGGAMVIARLAPQDYHRFHLPVTGKPLRRHMIEGDYNTVNPIAIRRNVDVYTTNKRCICPIETKEFDQVIVVAVGAAMVGSIKFDEAQDNPFFPVLKNKFSPHGYFAFGGSTVLIFFKPGKITFDERILANSNKQLETLVQVGDKIGVASK